MPGLLGDSSLDAPATSPARPNSPARATWRSFIEADGVTSCVASESVRYVVVVKCDVAVTVVKKGLKNSAGEEEEKFISWGRYSPPRGSVCRPHLLEVRETAQTCVRNAGEGGGRSGRSGGQRKERCAAVI